MTLSNIAFFYFIFGIFLGLAPHKRFIIFTNLFILIFTIISINFNDKLQFITTTIPNTNSFTEFYYILIYLFLGTGIVYNILSLTKNVRNYELGISLSYIGSALLVILSDNIQSLIISWEFMALCSIIIVVINLKNHPNIVMNYVICHVISGALLLIGFLINMVFANGDSSINILILNNTLQNIFDPNYNLLIVNLSKYLILLAILINIAIPPFNSWLTEAYSKLETNSLLLLSSVTTKASFFILVKLFFGLDYLLYIGLFALSTAAIYAMIEQDFKRFFSYSVIMTIGFMTILTSFNNPAFINLIAYLLLLTTVAKSLLLLNIDMTNPHSWMIVNLKGIFSNNRLIFILTLISLSIYVGVPGTSLSLLKYDISTYLYISADNYYKYCGTFYTILVLLSFPWQILTGKVSKDLAINKLTFSLFIAILILFISANLNHYYTFFAANPILKIYNFTGFVASLQLFIISFITFFLFKDHALQRNETGIEIYTILHKLLMFIITICTHIITKTLQLYCCITCKLASYISNIHLNRNQSISVSIYWIMVLFFITLVIYYSNKFGLEYKKLKMYCKV